MDRNRSVYCDAKKRVNSFPITSCNEAAPCTTCIATLQQQWHGKLFVRRHLGGRNIAALAEHEEFGHSAVGDCRVCRRCQVHSVPVHWLPRPPMSGACAAAVAVAIA